MASFIKYNWFAFFWAILILILCLMPGKDLPSITIFEFDKLVHSGIYLVLVYLMYYGWKKQSSFSFLHKSTILKILIITSSYGFIVEVMQELFTADRHFDIFDALANASGAVVGCYISPYIKNKLSQN